MKLTRASLLLSVLIFQATARAERLDFMQRHMGTAFRITIYTENETVESAKKAAGEAFKRVSDLDHALNDYIRTSETSRVQRAPQGRWIETGSDFSHALRSALFFSKLTGGVFDVTAGSLTHLWRKARALGRPPSPGAIEFASKHVGYKMVEAEDRRMRFLEKGIELDFGGIGKGIAVDEAFDSLRKAGFSRILVAGSGDLRVGLPPPEHDGWRIGISSPDAHQSGRFIEIKNVAVSSSGDLEQFFEVKSNGRLERFSHIIDLHEGKGLQVRKAVTVVAPDSTAADAMSTVLSIIEPPAASRFAGKVKGLEFFIETGSRETRSRGFPSIEKVTHSLAKTEHRK